MTAAGLDAAFRGGGDLGARMAALDWSTTPVGPPAGWPVELRTGVAMLLASKAQIVSFWGPEFVMFFNDAYASTLGAKREMALGRPGGEVWSEIWGFLRPLLAGVVTSGEAYSGRDVPFELERNGYPEETYFDISYDPMRSPDGVVTGVYCVVSETTGRVLGERRLRTLQALGSRLAATTSPGELAAEAVRVLGENPADVPYARIYLTTTGGEPELAAATGEESHRDAITVPLAAGTQKMGSLVLGVSRNLAMEGDYRGFFDLIGQQVSTALAGARAIEEERRQAAELAALDRAKSNFFANVSHEFRTPLTLLLGPLADLLATEPPGPRADALGLMHRNAGRLLKLVNDVLDFARLESDRAPATFVRLDLAARTAALVAGFEPATDRAGLRLAADLPPLPAPVAVDPEMWDKIVLNLVANAIKFTLAGEVRVALRATGTAAVLTVADTGVGIPADELPRLFQRFHRVMTGAARSHEGTGIGLALVHELVHQHDGTVTVDSEPGRGSTFTVSVPLNRAATEGAVAGPAVAAGLQVAEVEGWLAAETPVPPASPAAEGRVLVVDDNADLRSYVAGLLRPRWTVTAVADGPAALAELERTRYDLVISDVMMPGLDGIELVERVRAIPNGREVPLILLSARAGPEATVEGLASGADDYVVKPFAGPELVARVRANIELGRLRGRALRQVRGVADAALEFGSTRSTGSLLTAIADRTRELIGADRVTAGAGRESATSGGSAGAAARRERMTGQDGEELGWIEVWGEVSAPDQVVLAQLARLAAVRLDNARRFEVEHRIATTLQLDLLPHSLPTVAEARLTGRYQAGSNESAVGGDWYDAFATDGGELALVIGDVVGRGVKAAATMGQLRNALRVYLLEGFSPADSLAGLNRLVRTLDPAYQVATVACLRFDPRTGKISFASAGHPPPVVIGPTGTATLLHDRALGPPVGAVAAPRFRGVESTLDPGARLLLYTDGLIEQRGDTVDGGLGRLLAAAGRPCPDLDDLLDLMLAEVADPAGRDDIALLALESVESDAFSLRLPPDATRLAAVRRRLREFLTGHDVSPQDVFDLTLAVSEAGANAVEHPVDPAEPVIVVTARLAGDEVTITVRDTGRWRPQVNDTDRGRGLELIRTFADLRVDNSENGTTVTIRRRLGPK